MPRPIQGGKPACRRWSGGWVEIHRGDKNFLIPVGCSRWDCPDCSASKKLKLIAQVQSAWEVNFNNAEPYLVTLTYRGEWSAAATAITRNRAKQTPQQWDWMMGKHIEKLAAMWRRAFGMKLEYFWTTELTKRNVPHIHMIVPSTCMSPIMPKDWLSEAWGRITGDSHIVNARGRPSDRSVKSAVTYILKYITKIQPHWDYPHRRRYKRSAGFVLPIIGHAEKFQMRSNYYTGPVWDETEYRQECGKMYYYDSRVKELRRRINEEDFGKDDREDVVEKYDAARELYAEWWRGRRDKAHSP